MVLSAYIIYTWLVKCSIKNKFFIRKLLNVNTRRTQMVLKNKQMTIPKGFAFLPPT